MIIILISSAIKLLGVIDTQFYMQCAGLISFATEKEKNNNTKVSKRMRFVSGKIRNMSRGKRRQC